MDLNEKMLIVQGKPWAEQYRGSGRLTGHLAKEPTYSQDGEVAPGWTWVGHSTEDEFCAEFEAQQHDACHTQSNADWACSHCKEAGWA